MFISLFILPVEDLTSKFEELCLFDIDGSYSGVETLEEFEERSISYSSYISFGEE